MRRKRRIGIIACRVLEWNLRRAAARGRHLYRFDILPGGLHANPVRLHEELQRAIDHMEEEWQPEGIVIGYGLCGRGVAHLVARRAPLVLPRCEDCTAIFLGSQQRYREEFARCPGTFYYSCGWWRGQRRDERLGTARNRSLYDPQFAALREKYGEENARFIVQFRAAWRRNYRRAAYICFDDEPDADAHRAQVQALAAAENWAYEEIAGSEEIFDRLVTGRWDSPDIVVVNPGEMVVPAPGAEVMQAGRNPTAPYRLALARFAERRSAEPPPRSGLGLGIDAGGTFTDSVVYDFATGRVLSKSKAPTTHDDLAAGIRASLAGLAPEALRRVERVALSTTLATNAIVEGKGQPVGLLLMGIDDEDLDELQFELKRRLPGRLSMEGQELEPVDLAAARRAARELRDRGARAFAVSGYAATVDPRHELAVARTVRDETGLPVVCGHELSRQLNLYHRANTAGLNARLLPLMQDLIRSVRAVLSDFGLGAVRLMVVRGDGTQLLDRCAEAVPVETILSGPAASVVGAVTLSGRRDAIVADLGGTTLDIARVRDGRALVDAAGACVGGFRTSVEAMHIHTIGLGCDSEIHFADWPRLRLGPRRIVPLAVLAHEFPVVVERLARLGERDFDFAGRLPATLFLCRRRASVPQTLGERERAVLAVLESAPLPLVEVAARLGAPAAEFVPLARLEQLGLVMRAGPTPTDLLHVEGRFTRFCTEAAQLAFDLHARRLQVAREELCCAVRQAMLRGIAREILRAAFDETTGPAAWVPEERSAEFVLERLFPGAEGRVTFALRLDEPIVPIGAPVHAFFPELAPVLGAEVILPEHVEVANAVGAIAGQMALSERVEIVAAADGAFQVQSRLGTRKFFRFEEALAEGERLIRESLQAQAERNEVAYHEPQFAVRERTAWSHLGPIFLGVELSGSLRA